MKVSHDGGFAKIPYQFLPEAWKKAVPYDDANAKEFKEKQESQSGTTLTDAQKILSAQKDEARIRDEEKAKNDYRERVAALRLQLVGKKTYKEKSPITDQLKRLDIVERERLATLESQKEIARKLEAKKRSDDLQSKK